MNLPGTGLLTVTHAIPATSVLTTRVVTVEMLEKLAVPGETCEKLAGSGVTVNVIGLPNLISEV